MLSKESFKREIVADYIKLLKENTVNLYIINHQAEMIAFAYKKYRELVDYGFEDTPQFREDIFDLTWTIISEFYPIVGGNVEHAIRDVENIFKAFVEKKLGHPDKYIELYYGALNGNIDINLTDLYAKYCLMYTDDFAAECMSAGSL